MGHVFRNKLILNVTAKWTPLQSLSHPSSSPTSGSFLRPKKADLGIQFLDAVSSRYIPENIETADVEDSLVVSCKAVEMVGAEKIARTQR